jgi:hypothetical protein
MNRLFFSLSILCCYEMKVRVYLFYMDERNARTLQFELVCVSQWLVSFFLILSDFHVME